MRDSTPFGGHASCQKGARYAPPVLDFPPVCGAPRHRASLRQRNFRRFIALEGTSRLPQDPHGKGRACPFEPSLSGGANRPPMEAAIVSPTASDLEAIDRQAIAWFSRHVQRTYRPVLDQLPQSETPG